MEKIMNKIKNLLDLANNNPNENEAIAAALKAQELMAKYDIELAQLDDAAEQNREIVEEIYRNNGKHDMKKWRYGLATIVAKNFRCKNYFLGRQDVVFYGYKEDAKIAVQVFAYLYEIGNKLAFKKYYEIKKQGLPTKGVMNTYLIGFRDGIKSDLEKQCTALMIITPQEVTDKFEEKAKNFKHMNNIVKTLGQNNSVYNDGFTDGKNAVQSRSVRGSKLIAASTGGDEMQIENDTHQIFCKRLCEILDDQDLSYSDLARLAGLNRSTINHWLNGINPTIITVVKICQALYISSDYLLGLSDKP